MPSGTEVMLVLGYQIEGQSKRESLLVSWHVFKDIAAGLVCPTTLEACLKTAMVQNNFLTETDGVVTVTDRLYWQAGAQREATT